MANHAHTTVSKRPLRLGFRSGVEFTLPPRFRNKVTPGVYFRADKVGSEIVLRPVDTTLDDIIEEARRDYQTGNFRTFTNARDLTAALHK